MPWKHHVEIVTKCKSVEEEKSACHTLMESAIKRLIRYKGKVVNFNQVDKEYLIGSIDFLNHDVNEFDSKKADQNRPKKPLSDVYKEALFARVMV